MSGIARQSAQTDDETDSEAVSKAIENVLRCLGTFKGNELGPLDKDGIPLSGFQRFKHLWDRYEPQEDGFDSEARSAEAAIVWDQDLSPKERAVSPRLRLYALNL